MNNRLGICLCVAVLFGCSASSPRIPASSRPGGNAQEEETAGKKAAAANKPIAVDALEWGPYLLADLPSNPRGIAWESGFVSMRQIKAQDTEDLFDYRWYLSAVASGEAVLPTTSSLGCKNWPKKSGLTSKSFVDEATYSGAFSKAVKGTGLLQASQKDKDEDFAFVPGDEISVTLTGDNKEWLEKSPNAPEVHNLQFSGAFAGSLNVNTTIAVVNSNLESETTDLMLSDEGSGDAYTATVVIFFPGTAAASAGVRCVIPAGGSIAISAQDYKDWLPLKGFIAFSAMTSISEAEDGTWIWKSSINGDGVEDLTVP